MKYIKLFENFHGDPAEEIKVILRDNPNLIGDKSLAGRVSIQMGDVEGYIKYIKEEGGEFYVVFDIDQMDENGDLENMEEEESVDYLLDSDQESLLRELKKLI